MSAEFYSIILFCVITFVAIFSYLVTYKYYRNYYRNMDKEEWNKIKEGYLKKKNKRI